MIDGAADHEFDHFFGRGGGGVAGAAGFSVAEDGEAVADGADFLEEMGDVDDGVALGFEAADDVEHGVDVVLREGGGGLIEDEDAAADGEGAGDLDDLLGGGREAGDGAGEVEVAVAEGGEGVGGAAFHFAPVEEAEGGGLHAEEDVFEDGEVRCEGEFLVDHGDAATAAVEGVARGVGLTIEEHGAGVWGVGAGEGFHEGGFAGAVLADEGVDLAGHDGEGDAVEGEGGAEALFDVAHFKARDGGRLGHG